MRILGQGGESVTVSDGIGSTDATGHFPLNRCVRRSPDIDNAPPECLAVVAFLPFVGVFFLGWLANRLL